MASDHEVIRFIDWIRQMRATLSVSEGSYTAEKIALVRKEGMKLFAADVLRGQEALKDQTVRIRKALGGGVEGQDTEELARVTMHLLENARADAWREATSLMTDKQARDHLARVLQDKHGAWWIPRHNKETT